MIGAVLALGIVAPARADTITSGTYQVTEQPTDGYIRFYFTGGFTNLGPVNTDPNNYDAFVYQEYGTATVDGKTGDTTLFWYQRNLGCPNIFGCYHQALHSEVMFVPVTLGQNIDVEVFIGANWTNDLALTYSGGLLTAVPEPSTWAMLLIGFAGIGFMTYRSRNKLEYTARAQ
jgi:hypothetical protein